ncbi:MAG: HD domain-containing protein [Deltaproteobacteria bacterium]|nr:HD domain-containing protein [Deltaproteobacteria bacterium]
MIPAREECFELIRKYEMLPHIVRHTRVVTDVALFIANKLNDSGQHLDIALVEAGALLHDITKTISITTGEDHAQTGYELIASLGYPEVADIVRQHVRLGPVKYDPDVVTEAELVNYADKRVKHDKVVSLKDRFTDIRKRYKNKFAGLQVPFDVIEQETQVLEKKIFSKIDISPEEINGIFSESGSGKEARFF